MDSRNYFIVMEHGNYPVVKSPLGDVDEFAKDLINHYPAGTTVLSVVVTDAHLFVEDAATKLAIAAGYKAAAQEQERITQYNHDILETIKKSFGGKYAQDIRSCLRESEAPSEFGRLEIVDTTRGKAQPENWRSFKTVYVNQTLNGGMEGDSFAGDIFIPLPDGKYLKAPYSM